MDTLTPPLPDGQPPIDGVIAAGTPPIPAVVPPPVPPVPPAPPIPAPVPIRANPAIKAPSAGKAAVAPAPAKKVELNEDGFAPGEEVDREAILHHEKKRALARIADRKKLELEK